MPRPLVPNKFQLICEGLAWEGWQSFSIRQSLDSGAHSFSMQTTDRFKQLIGRWNVRGGSEIEIKIADETVFKGYVQKYSVNISADAHTITLEGASKAIDIIECSHLGPYFWKNTTGEAVIREVLKPFGLSVTFDKGLKAIGATGYKVEVEAKPFEIIKEIAARDGLTVLTDFNGNLRLYDGKNAPQAGSIGRGDYISISSDHDLSQAFSEIVVKSQQNDRGKPVKATFNTKQRSEATSSNNLILKTTANPLNVRHRPIVYVKNDQGDAAESFGDFVKSRFTGDVITASAVVKSHLNKAGKIWGIGQEVFLQEELLSVNQKLVVSEVDFSLSQDSGYQTNLVFKIPETYDPLEGASSASLRQAKGEFAIASKALAA